MTPDEIDDKIEEWHHDEAYKDIPLHEHLGWTWNQYKDWFEKGIIP